eukprot:scaffold543_cov312-Prasinococcus_capsulatus_cf.AAC.7
MSLQSPAYLRVACHSLRRTVVGRAAAPTPAGAKLSDARPRALATARHIGATFAYRAPACS